MAFGIPLLDQGLTGGPVLLHCLPGVDFQPFISQAAQRAEGPIVYLTIDRPPARVRADLAKVGVENIYFVDGHHPHLGMPPDGEPVDISRPPSVVQVIERMLKAHPDALLILDGLGTIAMQEGARLEALWPPLVKAAHKFPDAIGVYTDWGAPAPDLAMFGDEVRLLGVEKRVITHEFFSVRRQGGTPDAPVMYRTDGGRVSPYVPKVVVTGPANAGKSTFIRALAPSSVQTERNGTSVVGDRGSCQVRGIDVELFGTPGQSRFDPLLPSLLQQAVGVVIMVDATNRDDFHRTRLMLDIVRHACRHVVIVANKQDVEGALEPERLASELEITDHTPVIGCNSLATADAESALYVLLTDLLRAEELP